MRFFILPLLLILSFKIVAQEAIKPIHLGSINKQALKDNWMKAIPISQDSTGVFYLLVPYTELEIRVIASSDFQFSHVDSKGELLRRKAANFSVNGLKAKYEFIRTINNQVFVFTSQINKPSKDVTIYVHQLNKESLSLENPVKLISISYAQYKQDFKKASFDFELSKSEMSMLISYKLIDREGFDLDFGLLVFDNSFKTTFQWNGKIDTEGGVYAFDQFRVSNNGQVFLLTRYFEGKKAFNKNATLKSSGIFAAPNYLEIKPNYEIHVIKFINDNTLKVFKPSVKDHFLTTVDMEIIDEENLIMLGFTSTFENTVPSGAISLKIKAINGETELLSYLELGDTFRVPSDMTLKNNRTEVNEKLYANYRFLLSNIYFNKDGGFTLIGERLVTQRLSTFDNTSYIVNQTDDLAILDVSETGKINAIHKINKSQQVENLDFLISSYFYFERNNKRYFAFSDLGKAHPKNCKLVTLYPDGNQIEEVLFTNEETEVMLMPNGCVIYQDNNLMMYGYNNKIVRWMIKPI
jgi:hypothetical protein